MNKNISSCATFLYFIEVFFRSGQFRTAQRWWFLFSEIELVSNPLENQQLPWQKWWKATQYYDNKSEIWYHFFGSTHWNQYHHMIHIYLRFSTNFSLLHHVPKSLSIASRGTQELKYMTFPNVFCVFFFLFSSSPPLFAPVLSEEEEKEERLLAWESEVGN